MMLSPAATDTPAASVMVMLVPVLLPVAVPMFLTKAIPARASDAARPNRRASASVVRARGAGSLCESTIIVGEGGGQLPAQISAAAVAGLSATSPARPLARRPEEKPGAPAGPDAD